MNLENENMVVIIVVVAVALIIIVWLARKVGFKWGSDGMSLDVDKNGEKDTVSFEKIKNKSKLVIDEPREDLNLKIKDVDKSTITFKSKKP